MPAARAAGGEAGREARPASAGAPTVRVWDPFVRLFHWSLVLFFAAAYLTGDELERVHEIVGYVILALLASRIVWGFVGPPHARFKDFVHSPATTLAYARDSLGGHAKRYLGHNPLGGLMVLALIAGLLVTAGTGWLMALDLAGGERALEEVHETAANAMLVLIALHVAGVLWSSLAHGENLVRAMLSGKKRAA